MEFIRCWRSKQKATYSIECSNGQAFVKFSCSLGQSQEKHFKSRKTNKKTPSKIARDNARAADHQARKLEKSKKLHESTISHDCHTFEERSKREEKVIKIIKMKDMDLSKMKFHQEGQAQEWLEKAEIFRKEAAENKEMIKIQYY